MSNVITCLNVDYKIMEIVLVDRLKRTLDSVISEEQKDFVPNRLIHENIYLSQLIQAYLEEQNEEGIMIALDMEKAFDSCSWDYLLNAMKELGYGPVMCNYIRAIYNAQCPPLRRIRMDGEVSDWFDIGRGVAQGGPASPVLFLFITEALTRMMKRDLNGVAINNRKFILSQFADDTVVYLNNFSDLAPMWSVLSRWCEATGMRLNRTKTEAVRLGKLKKAQIPATQETSGINWVAPGKWITVLGYPFGESPDLDSFWEAKYMKCKCMLAHWHAVKSLTTFARAQITNSLIYSRFRYWVYGLVMPDHVTNWLISDAFAVLWDRNLTTMPDETGTDSSARPFMLAGAAIKPRSELGVSSLHWPSHVKAIQSQIILHYLDGSRSSWKYVLDEWYSRTPEGRGVVFSTTPTPGITTSTSRRAAALPAVFKQALLSFREIPFEKISTGEFLSPEEARAEPAWCSRLFTLRTTDLYKTWRSKAELNRIQDFINGTRIYSDEELINYFSNKFGTDHRGHIKIPGRIPLAPGIYSSNSGSHSSMHAPTTY